ncbi:MAG: adenylyl-sulfate kinase [Bacteroidetes bacterium]|nr:adenylyl-sulfate kinase [Bacteroidota bacterium]
MSPNLKQQPKVIWFTGRPSAGKTTLALALYEALSDRGFVCRILDGDVLRDGLNSDLGFAPADRIENIRRVAEVSKLFIETGLICINSFISPTAKIRAMAQQIIGSENFIEVFVNAPASVCEKRDVKGMYKKARAGLITDFTGVSAPFDAPLNPDIELKTDLFTVEACIAKALDTILPLISVAPAIRH